FDPASSTALDLPFVFLNKSPDASQLKAGAIVASWFGAFADYRGARIHAAFDMVPDGNSVVFRTGDAQSQLLGPAADSPRIRIIQSNSTPAGTILVIEAPDSQGLVQAAKALALGAWLSADSSVQVNSVTPPPNAARSLSPRWLDPTKATPLKQL